MTVLIHNPEISQWYRFCWHVNLIYDYNCLLFFGVPYVGIFLVKIEKYQNCLSFIIQYLLCLTFALDITVITEPGTNCKT